MDLKKNNYVYIIRDLAGRIKVGMSVDPEKRSKSIKYQDGIECYVVEKFGPFDYARSIERKAHEILSEFRIVGEWFSCNADEARRACSIAEDLSGHIKSPRSAAERKRESRQRMIKEGRAKLELWPKLENHQAIKDFADKLDKG